VLAGVLALPGCKDKQNDIQPPLVAPSATEPQPPSPSPATPSTPSPPSATPAAWPHLSPDARLPDAKVARPPDAAKPIASDADLAKFQEEKDRQESEKAVTGAVNGALSGVRACFDAQKMTAGSYQLKVRVHRSGRVLSSGVTGSGTSPELDRCVGKALGGLQVQGLKTDTIDVQREIKYTK
jgi:hypothetical protein